MVVTPKRSQMGYLEGYLTNQLWRLLDSARGLVSLARLHFAVAGRMSSTCITNFNVDERPVRRQLTANLQFAPQRRPNKKIAVPTDEQPKWLHIWLVFLVLNRTRYAIIIFLAIIRPNLVVEAAQCPQQSPLPLLVPSQSYYMY